MTIIATILPIFLIILLGWVFHQKGFLPREFLGPGNRLVFYLAIPAIIFRSVANASLTSQFDIGVVLSTLFAVLVVFGLTWLAVAFVGTERPGQRGAFVQSSFHGNIGYIALAIAYYVLGNDGLARTSIIAAFVIILQNLLAIFILQYYSSNPAVKGNLGQSLVKILVNPVIVASLAGILVSMIQIPIPKVINQTLEIIGGLALPMALLIIGASLSFDLIRIRIGSVLTASAVKLLVLPGIGFLFYWFLDVLPQDYLPGLIILATPTATVAVVMAHEIDGDVDFAVATVSASTLFSALTFTFWLKFSSIF